VVSVQIAVRPYIPFLFVIVLQLQRLLKIPLGCRFDFNVSFKRCLSKKGSDHDQLLAMPRPGCHAVLWSHTSLTDWGSRHMRLLPKYGPFVPLPASLEHRFLLGTSSCRCANHLEPRWVLLRSSARSSNPRTSGKKGQKGKEEAGSGPRLRYDDQMMHVLEKWERQTRHDSGNLENEGIPPTVQGTIAH
jgi:hypothetical protein